MAWPIVGARQVSVIARTRLRYFFALWLVVISLAWAAFGSKGVQAVASAPLRSKPVRVVPPLPDPPLGLRALPAGVSTPAALEPLASIAALTPIDAVGDSGPLATIAQHTSADLVVVVSID